ncbi:MAG: protein kinase family protein, partial [Leptolyngbya sp. SIO4C5]|nr:protein kinase family protein [Leptolyngbya sp. SIO4C5]
MRLPDLINRFRRRISESTNFVRHPTQVLSQKGRRRLQVWYENVNLPGSQKAKQTARQVKAPQPAADFFTQFQDGPAAASAQAVTASSTAVAVAPVSPPSPAPTIQDQRSLRPEEKLQGVWGGRYRVGEWRRSDVGLDLYEGIQEYSGEPVWIFVYHLSSEIFSRSEMVARRQAFEQLLSANLKLGHDRDFRLIKLVDAFVDHQQDDRCYLVTKPLPNACTLADHLEKYPYGLTAFQVRQVLYQVLQSLKYLHSAYRVYWPGETSEQCLYHGNLSLDSLWIRMANRHTATGEVQFFIYLSRFALWEHLFLPLQGRLLPTAIATHARDLGSPEADLRDLGWVAFSLLTGQKVDPQKVTLIDPQNAQYWPADPQTQVLKPYIWRLMGIGDEESFKSVDTAKAALDRLPLTPPPDPVADIPPPAVSEPTTERRQARLWLLAILLVLGLAGLVAWRWLRQSETVIELLNPCPEGSCELSDIPVLSQATSQYAVEFGSAWGKAINRSLMSPLVPRSDDPFEHALEARYNEEAEGQPLSLRRESLTKTEQRNERVALFRQLEQGELDFALMRLSDDLPETLNFEVVAFDAIAIFVAFSDANRAESTPQRLQGQIRLNRLRDILTSQTLPNESMPYKIYAPVADAASGTDESAAAELKATLFENPEQ